MYCFSVTFANDEQWSLGLLQHLDSFGDLVIAGQARRRRRTTGRKPVVTRSQELKSDLTCLNDLSVKLSNCFILARYTVDLEAAIHPGKEAIHHSQIHSHPT